MIITATNPLSPKLAQEMKVKWHQAGLEKARIRHAILALEHALSLRSSEEREEAVAFAKTMLNKEQAV